jgi:thiol:disulfide interchange protein
MKPRKALTIAFFVFLLGIGYLSMHSAPVLSDDSYSYHGETQWRTDFSEAEQLASEQDRPIVVYFWTTWCTYCEDYNQYVYSDSEVQAELDDFVTVAVNLDSDEGEYGRLQQQYNANYPPQHVIITPEGEQLVKISGYADREAFLEYLAEAEREYDAGDDQ